MRARACLVTRNVAIAGAGDDAQDMAAGFTSPYANSYGLTILIRQSGQVDRPGWDPSMAGYETLGVRTRPAGTLDMGWAAVEVTKNNVGLLREQRAPRKHPLTHGGMAP